MNPNQVPIDTRIYSDINVNWKLQPADSVFNLKSLRQKIMFIIGTYKGTRKWRENFGSHVHKYLFQPFDATTAGWISSAIHQAIEDPANDIHEDVKIKNVTVLPDHSTSTYYVKIDWRAPKLAAGAQKVTDSFSFNLRKLG